ncbi:MAG: transposase [Aestuariivita sp.]|nr:transposase [Aestuariivita sp.]MCY4345788.1 transposase [Aestuariivita sp.]
MSCRYRLADQVPYDVDLSLGGNARAAAVRHSRLLQANDVIVYDRGYFSRALLAHHLDKDLHPLFRLKNQATTEVAAFVQSLAQDRVLSLPPRPADPKPRSANGSWRQPCSIRSSIRRRRWPTYFSNAGELRNSTKRLNRTYRWGRSMRKPSGHSTRTNRWYHRRRFRSVKGKRL